MSPPRKWRRRLGSGIVIASLCVLAIASFCISPADETAMRTFTQAVDRWQVNPEFRAIAMEYSIRGSNAAASSFCFIPVRKVIIAIRSAPGLPTKYAVCATSRNHYNNFSRGPLSAYLYLCGEQNLPNFIEGIESAAHKNDLSDQEMSRMLRSLNLGFPIADDHGACQSIATTIVETNAAVPFLVRDNIASQMQKSIQQIASGLQFPTEVQSMTFDQQRTVLDRLDGYIKQHDLPLWRSKQISDTCCGIWAQAYGPPYAMLIKPILMVHDASRILLMLALVAVVMNFRRKSKRVPETPAPALLPADTIR